MLCKSRVHLNNITEIQKDRKAIFFLLLGGYCHLSGTCALSCSLSSLFVCTYARQVTPNPNHLLLTHARTHFHCLNSMFKRSNSPLLCCTWTFLACVVVPFGFKWISSNTEAWLGLTVECDRVFPRSCLKWLLFGGNVLSFLSFPLWLFAYSLPSFAPFLCVSRTTRWQCTSSRPGETSDCPTPRSRSTWP